MIFMAMSFAGSTHAIRAELVDAHLLSVPMWRAVLHLAVIR
ncbi:MAG TPA: hypothetical protein PKD54_10665 [Pirellulaceae bacterium]|nr:hypothetical protein [Pirellulaceae bacterium]